MPYNKQTKLIFLKKKIDAAREELASIWDAQGYANDIVLANAAKLDKLCNEYQQLIYERQGGKNP